MEKGSTFSFLNKAKFDYYKRYAEYIKVKCPFCSLESPRTRTYNSLKSLTWHIAREHPSDIGHPFNLVQVNEVLRAIAIAKEWRILA